VAGGAGRHALWLARRGLDVTLVDVSDVALAQAAKGDPRPGRLIAQPRDLEEVPLPAGPWDLILVFDYLQRSLFSPLAEALSPGGLLLYVQPTRRNLERHARPSARFLVEPGELRAAFDGALEIVRYDEGWLEGGRHQARLLGRRR
jgi:tellurite methyltransferase